MRYMSLPALNKRVTLGAYVKAVKLAKAQPETEFTYGLTTWWPTKGRDIVRQFMQGVHDRINARVPYVERGGAIGVLHDRYDDAEAAWRALPVHIREQAAVKPCSRGWLVVMT